MKRIIGVHYWEKKIHLCWAEEESISTASFNLPQDLRKDDLLKQEFDYVSQACTPDASKQRELFNKLLLPENRQRVFRRAFAQIRVTRVAVDIRTVKAQTRADFERLVQGVAGRLAERRSGQGICLDGRDLHQRA